MLGIASMATAGLCVCAWSGKYWLHHLPIPVSVRAGSTRGDRYTHFIQDSAKSCHRGRVFTFRPPNTGELSGLRVVHSLIRCVLTVQKRVNRPELYDTLSPLRYFILALCNDQPDGWANGKRGWTLKPVRGLAPVCKHIPAAISSIHVCWKRRETRWHATTTSVCSEPGNVPPVVVHSEHKHTWSTCVKLLWVCSSFFFPPTADGFVGAG